MGRGAVSQAQGLIRRAMWPAVSLLIIGTFAGHAVAGPNGLLAWGGYHRDLADKQQQLANAVCPNVTKAVAEFILDL